MRKIPTMFVRDRNDLSKITDECHSDCLWVFHGEGRATRKYDGTACLIENGKFYKRREVKPNKPVPLDFKQAAYDEVTGKRVGWVPVADDDRWHLEGVLGWNLNDPRGNGTYELVGPKVQGNSEGFQTHCLLSHTRDVDVYEDVPRTFEGLHEWLSSRDIEGLVFQHPDSRMAKIKKRDFGMQRASAENEA